MQINLSTSDLEVLRRLQRNLAGSSDYARVTCILMSGKGNSPSFVADCLGIDVSTVYRYKKAYLHGGENELLENRHKGYWGLLNSQQLSALREELTNHVYTDAKSVRSWIKSVFGIEYTVSWTVELLNRIGFSYKKTTEVLCGLSYPLRRLSPWNSRIYSLPSQMMPWFIMPMAYILRITAVQLMHG